MRTKELHSYLLDMSQLCYYYTNPHSSLYLALNEPYILLARGLNNYVSQSESKAPKSCVPFNQSPV